MIVFQPAVDPFGRAAFAVTNLIRHAVPNGLEPFRLQGQFLFQTGRRAGIDINDRNMAQIPASSSRFSF